MLSFLNFKRKINRYISINKGFSIPIVVTLVIILSIAIYSLESYSSHLAKTMIYSAYLKKADYIAQSGMFRAISFISSQSFNERIYKSNVNFSFGFFNTYKESYADGYFNVIIIDIPQKLEIFNIDFKISEYLGVLIWASGHYKNASKYIMARYIPINQNLKMFDFKKIIDEDDDYSYIDIELN